MKKKKWKRNKKENEKAENIAKRDVEEAEMEVEANKKEELRRNG